MRALAITAATAALLSACGDGGASLAATALHLPTGHHAMLASTTTYTSPDGGIYRNPLKLDVVAVARVDAGAVAAQLGSQASDWAQLDRFGRFTVVAVRLHNDGKAWSEPELRDLQIASDFAPPGTASGPLRHFYHPTYTLAAIADVPLNGSCQPHLDPGQSTTVVLVYPPVHAQKSIVWGRYREFALRLRFGGAIDPRWSHAHLHAVACPPQAPPP